VVLCVGAQFYWPMRLSLVQEQININLKYWIFSKPVSRRYKCWPLDSVYSIKLNSPSCPWRHLHQKCFLNVFPEPDVWEKSDDVNADVTFLFFYSNWFKVGMKTWNQGNVVNWVQMHWCPTGCLGPWGFFSSPSLRKWKENRSQRL